MQTLSKTKRIEWIDAMRGFTMILVVFSHVETWGMNIELGYDGVNDLFRQFRMPLFFFVSGFIAFRPNEDWNWQYYQKNLLKKMRVQMIPMLAFGLFFTYFAFTRKTGNILEQPLISFINSPLKMGYWFTEALLGMFCIYYTVSFLFRKVKLPVRQVILSAIALVLYAFTYNSYTHFENHKIANWFCLYYIFLYFQFFVFGNIVSNYREKILKWLGNSYVSSAILLLFIGTYTFYCSRHDVQTVYVKTDISKLTAEFFKYIGILTMVMIFKNCDNLFSLSTRIGRSLQYIGRRTLDVYLLHYFFIPILPAMGTFFATTNNTLLELVVVLSISLAVIGISLLISNILRISPILAHYLFGAKKEAQK